MNSARCCSWKHEGSHENKTWISQHVLNQMQEGKQLLLSKVLNCKCNLPLTSLSKKGNLQTLEMKSLKNSESQIQAHRLEGQQQDYQRLFSFYLSALLSFVWTSFPWILTGHHDCWQLQVITCLSVSNLKCIYICIGCLYFSCSFMN